MRSIHGYRLRAGIIPEPMHPAPREYYWSHEGIASRSLFDERADHRGRVSHGVAACDEIGPIDKGGEAHESPETCRCFTSFDCQRRCLRVDGSCDCIPDQDDSIGRRNKTREVSGAIRRCRKRGRKGLRRLYSIHSWQDPQSLGNLQDSRRRDQPPWPLPSVHAQAHKLVPGSRT